MYDWKKMAEHEAENRRKALETPGPDGGPVVFERKFVGDGEFSVSGNGVSFGGFFSLVSADDFAKKLTVEHAARWSNPSNVQEKDFDDDVENENTPTFK